MEISLEELKENLALLAFCRSRKDNCCVGCGSNAIHPEDFDDDLSRKEFQLTHWCQVCQDSFYDA